MELKSGGYKPSIITTDIHDKLQEKLHDSSNPLRGYWEAQQWLYEFVKNKLNQETIKSITNHDNMVILFLAHFNI